MERTSRLPRFAAIVAFLIGLSYGPVRACLNDRDSDTLAQQAEQVQQAPQTTAESGRQASGLPDVVRVITGRFERNPPLFYVMRLHRVAAEISAHPDRLALYDDAAVACDRLQRDDAAIRWIERKRQRLNRLNAAGKNVHEHWYRYYANCGTFWVHRWLRAGADRKRLHEVQQARDYIARAIQLKPNAHFGREKYQLQAIQWIVHPTARHPQSRHGLVSFADYMSDREPGADTAQAANRMVEGLSGLIVLGNAWESVDVFDALSRALGDMDKVTLQYLAMLRCSELVNEGRLSLLPNADIDALYKDQFYKADPMTLINDPNKRTLEQLYHRLRTEAEQWQQQRTTYMIKRLEAGRHPDTDTTFWTEYRDAGPPSLQVPWYSQVQERQMERDWLYRSTMLIAVLLSAAAIVLFYFWVHARHRFKNHTAAEPPVARI